MLYSRGNIVSTIKILKKKKTPLILKYITGVKYFEEVLPLVRFNWPDGSKSITSYTDLTVAAIDNTNTTIILRKKIILVYFYPFWSRRALKLFQKKNKDSI